MLPTPKLRSLLVCTIALLATGIAAAQNTIHVPADQPTIQAGINAANTGDTVLVAPGTYYENLMIAGKAITLKSTAGAPTTIIDGSRNYVVLEIANEMALVTIDGFTLQDGATNYSPSDGGLLVNEALVTVQNSIITGNYGNAIAVNNGSINVLNNHIVTTAPDTGKNYCHPSTGVYIFGSLNFETPLNVPSVINGNLIEGDGSLCSGSGISVVTEAITISNNTIRNSLLGLYLYPIEATIQQNLFYGNEQGGIYVLYETGAYPPTDPTNLFLVNNTIYNNLTNLSNQDVYSQQHSAEVTLSPLNARMSLSNNLIIGNSTTSPTLICSADQFDGINYFDQTPAIIDHNDIINLSQTPYPLTVDDCSADTAADIGLDGNISLDPRFKSINDFHPSAGSPAIDAGNNSADYLPPSDLEGNPRIVDATGLGYPVIDMGVYEAHGTADAEPVSLALTSSIYYVTQPTSLTLTALPSASSPVNDGVINLYENDALIGFQPAAPSDVSFQVKNLPPGLYRFKATLTGTAGHSPATSTMIYVRVTDSVTATTTTLTSSLNPSTYGQSVTFKAIVSGTTTATGSITFSDGTTTLATVPLDASGNASFTTSSLIANDPGTTPNHTNSVTYNPTGSFAASSASLSQIVNGLPTTNTLTISPASGTPSTTYTLTATLKSASSVSSAAPTGPVVFYISPTNGDPGIPIGTATLTNGAATLTSSTLPVSSGFAYELYAGDNIYANSTSNSINVDISASPTTTTTLAITAGGSPVSTVPAGTVVTLTATTLAGTSPISPGQVNFCDATAPNCLGLNLIGTAQLTPAGAAALKFVARAGTHSYNAVFLGTSTNTTSSSPAQPLTVTVTSSPGSIRLADTGVPGNYTLTATVTGSAATTPTGTVSFLDTTNANYLLGSATLSTGTSGLIWTASTIPTNVSPGSLVAADFNNDGYADLALTTRDSVSILNGNGNGEFPRTTTVAVGHAPGYLAVADFNGDGTPDLAISNQSDGSVTILTSSGNGFDVFAPIPVGLNVEAITTGDFNHDGNADFAVIYNENSIAVFLGKGDGTFTPVAAHPTTDVEPTSIVTGDFNGDGNLDLIVSNAIGSGPTVNGNLTVLLGNGDGTFTPAASPSTGVNPESIAVGDFNNDGKLDLAVANYTSNTVTILLGKGDGTFSSSSVAAGAAPWSVSVADFNGDGIPDLLVVPAVGATAATTILIGKGDGTFSATTGPTTGNAPLYGVIADFNSDGVPDFAISNAADSTLGLFLTQTAGTSTAVVNNISPVGTGPHLVDATYGGSTSNTVSLTAQRVPTTLALTATAAPSGGAITLTAVISPNTAQNHSAGGSVTFFDNGNTLGTGTVSSGVATLAFASFPAGLNNLSAQYSGDTNFAPSSGTGSITIAPPPPADFTFIGPPTVTFRTGSTGVATLSLASLNGFAAPIAITCNSPLPPNYLCTLSNSTVSLAANNTASLTLTLHPNLNASLTFPPRPFPSKTAVALASLLPFTLLSLFRRRRRNPLHRLLLLVCLAAAATALTACGSNIDYLATPPGLYPITITATGTSQGASASTTHTLLLNANITP